MQGKDRITGRVGPCPPQESESADNFIACMCLWVYEGGDGGDQRGSNGSHSDQNGHTHSQLIYMYQVYTCAPLVTLLCYKCIVCIMFMCNAFQHTHASFVLIFVSLRSCFQVNFVVFFFLHLIIKLYPGIFEISSSKKNEERYPLLLKLYCCDLD